MLKDAADHLNKCNYAGVKCGFEGCGEVIVRSEIAGHRVVCAHRTVKCKWDGCEQQLKAVEMEQHQLVCPKRTVLCPNGGCSNRVPHDSLPRHRAICKFEMCACPFADVGCTTRIRLRDIEKHEQDHSVQHNRLLLKAFKEQQQAHASLKDQVMPDSERIVFRVKHDVLTGKESFVPRSPVYPTRLYSRGEDHVVRGYNTRIYVETNDSSRPEYQNCYGLYLAMASGRFPCKVDSTFVVEHHDGKAASTKTRTTSFTYDCSQARGYYNMISKAEIVAPDSPYVKDGYATFKISFKFV